MYFWNLSLQEGVGRLQTNEIYHNTLRAWTIALAVAIAFAMLSPLILGVVRRRAEKLSKYSRTWWLAGVADVLQQTRYWFLLLMAVALGARWLTLPDQTRRGIETIAIIGFLLQAAIWGARLIQYSLDRYMQARLAEHPSEVTTISALGFFGKMTLYAIILLLILDNLGIEVTPLIAGLGVGGIAVALAAQNILGDIFSSMSIVLDKPFVLGDLISVGGLTGTVENIGLKTTRVRALSGEQLVFSNSDLLGSRLQNFKRMRERRIVFTIGVTYDTPVEKLKRIPEWITGIVESQQSARLDRAHFAKFGDFALLFEVVYFVLSSDYRLYMNIQQAINLQLMERFAAEQIEFAFPTQTLHLYHQERPGDSFAPTADS